MKRNSLKDILPLAKELGFGGTDPDSEVGNPYMCLDDGRTCLLLLAGGLIGLTTIDMHFSDEELYKTRWTSKHGNMPYATMSTTKNSTEPGQKPYSKLYYRVAFKNSINQIAKDWKKAPESVLIDHINHMRGDCRRENLQVASAMQNQRNRSKTKVERAFYTIEDYIAKRDSKEWTPLADQSLEYIRSII